MKRWQIVYGLPLEVWVDIFSYPWITRENIKSFDRIGISAFDAQTMDFFEKIRPLLTDVEVVIRGIPRIYLENLRTFLTHLAPMLNDGIQSLECDAHTFPLVKEQLFREKEKLAKPKVLDINFFYKTVPEIERENVNSILNWLVQPDTDGPRFFDFRGPNEFYEQLFKAIREQFFAATTPRTFSVNFDMEEGQVAEFHLENSIGEVLHGERVEYGEEDDEEEAFRITRHKAGWNTKEAQKWINEMTIWKDYRRILIDHMLTMGSFDAAAQMDWGRGTFQQPCSSKDA